PKSSDKPAYSTGRIGSKSRSTAERARHAGRWTYVCPPEVSHSTSITSGDAEHVRRASLNVRVCMTTSSNHLRSARSGVAPLSKTTERGLGFVVVKMLSSREGRHVRWPALFFIGHNVDGSL